MEQLAFVDPSPSPELDELQKQIDLRLDACFLGDLEEVLARLRDDAVDPDAAAAA